MEGLASRRTGEGDSSFDELGHEQAHDFERIHDCTHLDSSFYSKSELLEYSKILRDVLRLSPENATKWIEKLLDGHDEPHKAMFLHSVPT
jgi:secreted Zn-dependent insulinase-like peptidase